MKWIRLVDSEEEYLPRGTVFRLPGEYPYEDVVDFMVFDPEQEGEGQGLIVTSGYKAGLILVILPKESAGEGSRTLSRKWVVENWSHWIYPECDVSDVVVSCGYPKPVLP